MTQISSTILVRHFRSTLEYERRLSQRIECGLDATTHSVDAQESLAWGAGVRNISCTGIGLTLCFPFHTGTYLSLELLDADRRSRTILSRVINVHDQNDGSWHVGCQFLEALSQIEVDSLMQGTNLAKYKS